MTEQPDVRPGEAARCEDPNHCITCSDEGTPMRVVALGDCGLAWCAGPASERTEVMTALVDNVRLGDLLLVHAGTALTRLEMALSFNPSETVA